MDTVNIMGFYRFNDFKDEIGMSASSWAAGVKSGRFPPKFQLGPNIVLYLKADIYLFLKYIKANKRPHKDNKWEVSKKSIQS